VSKDKKNIKPTRGMPRSLIYAMIPGGFLVIVLILVLTGFWRQETADEPPTIVDQPAGTHEPPDDAQ